MMNEKKYYWLKLPKDFFKRHDIKFIKTLPNGDEIILFYLELMAESIDHEGELRFSSKIPYTEKMLASVTDTPVETVKAAMEALKDLDLVTVSEDGTIKLEKVSSMIGFETRWAEKKRAWREQQKQLKGQNEDNVLDMSSQCPQGVLGVSDKSKRESKSIEKEIEKELEIDKRESTERDSLAHFVPPTVEEVFLYCEGRHNGIDAQRFVDYYTARGWKNVTDWKAQVRVWESRESDPCA